MSSQVSILMSSTRSLSLCLLLLSFLAMASNDAFAADSTFTADSAAPWSDQWSMTLKGNERWYVEYEGSNYLEVIDSDTQDLSFLVGKDVMIQTKFRQLDGVTAQFYSFPTLQVGTNSEAWSTIIDGDNIFVLGKAKSIENGRLIFTTKYIIRAPSDSAIIAKKLAQIKTDDYDARVKFAHWVRKTGVGMGNRNVWMTAADNIVDDAINAVSQQAEKSRNIALLLKVMNWSTEELSDKSRAAALGSQTWLNELSEEKTIAITERMGILGLTKYDGRWMTKSEQKILDFHKKLRSMKQENAKGFFDLANEIGQYRDVLPEAIQLQHMALQKGLSYNPNSNLLRQALGKKTVEQETAILGLKANYSDDSVGLSVSAPEKWNRSKETIDGDVTWIDPRSQTAYVSLTVIRGAEAANFASLFDKQMENIKTKQGYSEQNAEALGLGNASREARFSFLEGREERQGILSCTLYNSAHIVCVIYASYIAAEAADVETAYKHILDQCASVEGSHADSSPNATSSDQSTAKPAATETSKTSKTTDTTDKSIMIIDGNAGASDTSKSSDSQNEEHED